jgi:thiosulfate reductase cytochrome b subunit
MQQTEIAKFLITIGSIILLAGIIFWLNPKLFNWLGNLPGDFKYKSKNFSFHFPLATSILISIVVSIILYILGAKK